MPRIVAKLPVSEGLSQPQHAPEIYTPIEQPQRSHDCCNTEQLPLLHQWSQRLQHKKSLSIFTTHDPEVSEVQMFRARKRYDLP